MSTRREAGRQRQATGVAGAAVYTLVAGPRLDPPPMVVNRTKAPRWGSVRPTMMRAVVPPPAGLERLLDDAASLDGTEIELLAAQARRARRAPRYAEALLAIRRAADRSGRGEEVSRAGIQAEHLVASAARAQSPSGLEDRARWNVVVAEASWGAGDAARALVVSDLLPTGHLAELTSAWHAARALRPR